MKHEGFEVELDNVFEIMITGSTSLYKARVIGYDRYGKPRLKVIDDSNWEGRTLKSDDYILLKKIKGTSRSETKMEKATKVQIEHDVKMDYVGINARTRLTCYSQGCGGATLVRQPHMRYEDWERMVMEFADKHPCSKIENIGWRG